MARIEINYNTLINKAMHRPVIKSSGFVLYPKVEGASDTEGGSVYTVAEKDENYQRMSKETYNSATNIRRLFITNKRVIVHYYTPYKHKGGDGTYTNSKEIELSVECNKENVQNLKQVVSEIYKEKAIENKKRIAAQTGMQLDPKDLEPVKLFRFKGNAFGVLSNIYACNNIEEVYVDWAAMATDDVQQYLSNVHLDFYTPKNIGTWTQSKNYMISRNRALISELLCRSNSCQDENALLKRFPRLMKVGIISNLDNIVQEKHGKVSDNLSFLENVDKRQSWYTVNKSVIEQSGSIVIVGDYRPEDKPNLNFKVKTDTYKFDRDKLKAVFDSYITKINDLSRSTTYGVRKKNAEEEESLIVGPLEAEIRTLKERNKKANKPDATKLILRIASVGMNKDAKEKVVAEMKNESNRKLLSEAILGSAKANK